MTSFELIGAFIVFAFFALFILFIVFSLKETMAIRRHNNQLIDDYIYARKNKTTGYYNLADK